MGINEYFLPNNLTFSEALKLSNSAIQASAADTELVYQPVLLGQARVYFLNRKYNLDYELPQTFIVPDPDRRGAVRWENFKTAPIDPRRLDDQPSPRASFASLNAPLSDSKIIAALQKDFIDWVFRSAQVTVRSNASLNIFSGPNISQADFRQMCTETARKQRDIEVKKATETFERKLDSLQEKLKRESRELDQDEAELSTRKMEEIGKAAETVLGLFAKRKKSISASLTKRRMTATAKADVEESKEVIADLEKQIAEIEDEKAQAIEEVEKNWSDIAGEIEEITVTPLKKDISIELFGVAWFPYFQILSGDQVTKLPAFGAE